MQRPVYSRFALIAVVVFSISMPSIVVADDQSMLSDPASTSADTPATPSAKTDDTNPEVEDEVAPASDPVETAPSHPVLNDPGNDIPQVEDEVDPTDDRVETAPPPPAPDVPDVGMPVVEDEPDSTDGTVERAPPTDTIETPIETIPVVVETVEPTIEATEEPTPTAVPVTPEPTSTPAPSPTPAPAIPFNPDMKCVPAPGSAAPVAGHTAWTYLDCTASWETKDVSSVSLQPTNRPVGWDIVPLNDRAIQNPDQMILNPQPLDLIDTNPVDDVFAGAKFHIAMRVSCVDVTAVTIPLQFQSTSGEDSLRETVTANQPFSATAATLPEVQLISAEFDDVNPPEGTAASTGVITMDYTNASESCGWKITTNVDDFVAPDDVLSVGDLTLVDVSGPEGLTSSIEGGEITMIAPPGVTMPASGTLTITVSLPVPETVSSGVYSTTITADAGAP